MVRRFILSRSDIFEGRWSTSKMSDLKAPTYEDPVGRAFMVRITNIRGRNCAIVLAQTDPQFEVRGFEWFKFS